MAFDMDASCDASTRLHPADLPVTLTARRGARSKARVLSASRRFATSAALITASNIFVRILGLAALPVLTRFLAPSAYGVAALVTTAISLVSVFALAGADVSYIRASQDHTHDPRTVEHITWRFSFISAAIASSLSILFWLGFSPFLGLPRHDFVFLALGILFAVLSTMAVARARLLERYNAIAIATAASGFGAVLSAILVALAGVTDEAPLLINVLVSFLIPILLLGTPAFGSFLRSSEADMREQRAVLGIGAAIIFTAPAYWVMSSLDRWFLLYFEDSSSVGIYSVAISIGLSGLAFNAAITTIWTPEATRLVINKAHEDLGKIVAGLTLALAIVWLAVSSAGGDIVRLLAPPGYWAGAATIPYLAGGVFFHGMIHLANALYVTEKRVHHTMVWWAGGMAIIVILNVILIPHMGMTGAALSQLLGFGFVFVALFCGAGTTLLPYVSTRRSLLALALILLAAPAMIHPWSDAPLLSLALKLPAGLSVAALAAWAAGGGQSFARWRAGRMERDA